MRFVRKSTSTKYGFHLYEVWYQNKSIGFVFWTGFLFNGAWKALITLNPEQYIAAKFKTQKEAGLALVDYFFENQNQEKEIPWNPSLHKLITKYAVKASTVIDIGAKDGAFTVLAAKILGKDGQVLAFEPCKKYFSSLQKNIKDHGHKNILTFRHALGNTLQEIKFKNNQIIVCSHEEAECVVCTLDGYGLALGIVTIIKIYAPRWELKILLGASKVIKNNFPLIIIEEVSETLEIKNFLNKLNYDFSLKEGTLIALPRLWH